VLDLFSKKIASYKASMAPTTPMAASPANSMPTRPAPLEAEPLEVPAAPVGLVPALPAVVGPAVPAVERTVPLLESVE
jgi:hypothetical protein